ncbi:MAG: hypothetical protein P8Q37_07915 [Porticoccaceae bacterium]|nr:hypothetical protein [Porticoccaceae bacterium]MDG1474817.1 hypothetical protein [Porticoccaceae bacterium]
MKLNRIAFACTTILLSSFGVFKSAEFSNTAIKHFDIHNGLPMQSSFMHTLSVGPLGKATIEKIVTTGKNTRIIQNLNKNNINSGSEKKCNSTSTSNEKC